MLSKIWMVVLCSALLAPIAKVNAKTMAQFYGSELYNGSYDFNDLKRSLSSDAVYDNRVGFKGLAAHGFHVNVLVSDSETGAVVADKQRVRQSLHTIAWKDNPESLSDLNACKFYHDFMLNQEVDDQVNLKITIKDMPKWRVLREPAKLRQTRIKIYFNKRAVRILNSRIKVATDENRITLLKKVRDHFSEKVSLLYSMHSHLMEEHDLPWKPRRWIWADFAKNDAYCYEGDSFNAETWYEVKKEISVIEAQIKAVMDANSRAAE